MLFWVRLDLVRLGLVKFGTIFASSAFHDSTVNVGGNYNGKHFLRDYFIENRFKVILNQPKM